MRKRAFLPESVCRLEGRAVPSGGPVVLSAPRYFFAQQTIKGDFELFALSGNFERLRAQLATNSTGVPFHHAAGLGPKTNAALDQMLADIAAGAPHPIRTAYRRVIAGADAVVRSGIGDGTIVVRR